jgi:hypothetical protein
MKRKSLLNQFHNPETTKATLTYLLEDREISLSLK